MKFVAKNGNLVGVFLYWMLLNVGIILTMTFLRPGNPAPPLGEGIFFLSGAKEKRERGGGKKHRLNFHERDH